MIRIGIDYYPEHWDRSLWEEDAARMEALGVHVVRIGEFAWSRLEPRDGVFDFDWLDDAIEVLAGHAHQLRPHVAVPRPPGHSPVGAGRQTHRHRPAGPPLHDQLYLPQIRRPDHYGAGQTVRREARDLRLAAG